MLKEYSDSKHWKVYGSLNPRILIAGHSHTFAMFQALDNSPKFSELAGIVTQSDFKTHRIIDFDYWDFVAEISNFQPTFISWNGNQHNIHFLIQSDDIFRISGLEENISENYPVIPVLQIRELFKPTFDELRLVLSRFKQLNNLTLLGTPAPKPREVIKQRITTEKYYTDVALNLGLHPNQIEITSDALRVFMWDLTQKMTQEISQEFGIKFFPTPSSTLTQNKTLKSEFLAEDVTHADIKFGELILEELLKLQVKNG